VLSVLSHFFEHGRWGCPAETVVEGQSLAAEDQLFILMQAGLYLTATRGFSTPEARICYERAESLCHSLKRPLDLFSALEGQWRYSIWTDKLATTMQIAKRLYSLAQEQNDSTLMIGAYRALAATFYFLGDFDSARQNAMRGVQIWRSGGVQSRVEDINAPVVICLCFRALSEWQSGEIASCQVTMAEAILLAKELNDMHGLAFALYFGGILARFERNPAEAERFASELIELSTHYNFAFWLPGANVLRGWARSVSGDTTEGISWIEDGIGDYRATGSMLLVPLFLALKAEALHLAERIPEALEAIREAEALVERFEGRCWSDELYRLRGVFLAAIGADETLVGVSFNEAIRIAREQKSISLEKRAEGTYAEYRRRKASASGGRGFRLPLC
jgi:tetratricopeptide (TPR) repeat protein